MKKYKKLYDAGLLHGSMAEAKRKRAARNENLSTVDRYYSLTKKVLIPLSEKHKIKAYRAAKADRPRKKNFSEAEPHSNKKIFYNHDESFEYRGSYKGWFGSRCIPYMKSFGIIHSQGKKIYLKIDEKSMNRKAPKGFIFANDDNGLHIVSKQNDDINYHFNSSEIIEKLSSITAKAKINHKERQKRERQFVLNKKMLGRIEKIKKNKLNEIFVTVNDSKKAGNCLQGILNFKKAHGIAKNYIRADVLKRIATTSKNLVEISINEAIKRHLNDMKRGFSKLNLNN